MNDAYLRELYRRRDNVIELISQSKNAEESLSLQKELLIITDEISKEKLEDSENIFY